MILVKFRQFVIILLNPTNILIKKQGMMVLNVSFKISGEKTVFYVVKGKSGRSPLNYFFEYDEASQYVNQYNDSNPAIDDEALFLCSRADEDHYELLEELIEGYLHSGCVIDQPVIVFYKRSKTYEIVPKSILTKEHWVERPFTIFGSVSDNNILIKDPFKNVMSRD